MIILAKISFKIKLSLLRNEKKILKNVLNILSYGNENFEQYTLWKQQYLQWLKTELLLCLEPDPIIKLVLMIPISNYRQSFNIDKTFKTVTVLWPHNVTTTTTINKISKVNRYEQNAPRHILPTFSELFFQRKSGIFSSIAHLLISLFC